MTIAKLIFNTTLKTFSLTTLLFVALAGCALKAPPFDINMAPYSARELKGENTARHLTDRYNNTVSNCGTSSAAAFQCSGVILRGTSGVSTEYHSWNPSPASVKSGGISFSYLRADSKYDKLAYGYNNGFIFYPKEYVPEGKINVPVLCSFPIDAGTSARPDKQGCDFHTAFPTNSQECQSQGITTASQWMSHYTSVPTDRRSHECGFNVRSGLANQADAFNASLQGMALNAAESFSTQNELRLATWDQDIGNSLPIEAFFYLNDGLADAQFEQRDFYDVTGITAPIIFITLPSSPEKNATFEYRESDQIEFPTDDKIKPSVLETYNIEGDHLRMSDIYDATHITVEIPEYEGINGGKDTIRVYWTGRVNYISSIITAANPPAKTEILIPRSEVIDNIGRSVNVKYSVKENGIGDTKESASLILYIDPQAVDPLPPPTYSDSTVSTNYAGETGDTIKLRWAGTTTHDTATQNVIPGKPNTFSIPSDWLAENAGKEVLINYSIKRNSTGSNLMFSQILRMTMP
ncbi:hypothetical protein ACIGCH_14075 [Pseudomonas helleri]|uniref:Uncharacterized protein n=1 Tax=Pseudomonas helleri TaxID=1608996 RepID=A0A6A7YUA7_9PSED|nr:hypothetical protein [Pseudomonas helleri]MQT25215.1 hypothetical protein [Pseudomonas helleri]MQT79973.1 hypothetical protein [Pseudomonas helleri]MQU16486.1 hypothetical protein [Pseudomonas helleri]